MENYYDIIKTMKFSTSNPNNIRLYHGTTHEGGKSIPTEGFLYNGSSMWSCSDDDNTYFYELNRFIKVEGLEDDGFDYQQYYALHRANESGQLQEAVLEKPSYHTYIIELVVPPEFAQFIEDDVSCDGMENTGAVQISNDALKALFETGEYAMHVYKSPFAPKCALLYLTGVYDTPYFCGVFTDVESHIVEVLHKNRVFCEELLDSDIIYEQSFAKDDYKVYNG